MDRLAAIRIEPANAEMATGVAAHGLLCCCPVMMASRKRRGFPSLYHLCARLKTRPREEPFDAASAPGLRRSGPTSHGQPRTSPGDLRRGANWAGSDRHARTGEAAGALSAVLFANWICG